MSFIEANITIDLPDGVKLQPIIQQLESLISSINDKDTDINIIEVDDPMTMNPIYFRGE